MNREDARKILGEGATEEQVSNLLNNFHTSLKAKEDENRQLKAQLESQNDYASIKAQLDEVNRAKMTEQEKIAAQQKEAEERLAKANKIYNAAKAKEILSGLSVDDSLINSLVTDDETVTIQNANMLKTQLEMLRENVTKSVKEELSSIDIKPNPTNVAQIDNGMTREKFAGMSMSEQKQWKDANYDQYREMFPAK